MKSSSKRAPRPSKGLAPSGSSSGRQVSDLALLFVFAEDTATVSPLMRGGFWFYRCRTDGAVTARKLPRRSLVVLVHLVAQQPQEGFAIARELRGADAGDGEEAGFVGRAHRRHA